MQITNKILERAGLTIAAEEPKKEKKKKAA